MEDMIFCPLYSGSSGNVLFCQYGGTRLLVDAGKSGSCIATALKDIGVEMDTLSGVLITHEHSDHIAGAGVLARKYGLPLYATADTWWAMRDKVGRVPAELCREIAAGQDFWLGDIGVRPFSIPHDAADPVGFRLWGGSRSVSVATDLGHFGQDTFDRVAGSDIVLLESNHDPDLLRANPRYNAALKRRILGDRGHLSNQACAEVLVRLVAAGTGTVILGHLSGENNTPELAWGVSASALEREGIRQDRDVQLRLAPRDRRGEVFVIRSK